jgi:hypothetical protein
MRMDIEYFPETKVVLIHGHEPKVVPTLREQVARLAAEQIDSLVKRGRDKGMGDADGQ